MVRLFRSARTMLVAPAVFLGLAAQVSPSLAQGVEFEPQLIEVFETDSLYLLNAVVSPDERWIVISAGPDLAQYSLYSVPAEGGQLRRLTDGGFHDTAPQWSPDGHYIYFLSDRGGGPTDGETRIYRLPFDSASGEASDVPRPVSLEGCNYQFSVSPDGEWMAFFSPRQERADAGGEIRIVPAAGGPSRTLAETEPTMGMGWSSDGERVTYALMDRSLSPYDEEFFFELWQVDVDGGEPEMLSRREGMISGLHHSDEEVLWTAISPGDYISPDYLVTDLSGDTLVSFSLPPDVRVGNAGWSSRYLAPYSDDSGMPIFIVPLDGGDPRMVSGHGVEGDPTGWMPDGRLVVDALTEIPDNLSSDGEPTYYAFDPSSGAMTRLPALDGVDATFGATAFDDTGARAFIFDEDFRSGGEMGSGTVLFLDLETGERRELVEVPGGLEGPGVQSQVFGRGGQWARDGDFFYYLIWHPDHRDLYRVRPAGDPELVWTFRRPSAYVYSSERVAVHGDRLAWVAQEEGDSVGRYGKRIMLGDLSTGESKEILRRDEWLDLNLIWSNDGRKLAAGFTHDGKTDLGILEVDASGELVGEPTIVPLGTRTWYNLYWLPGDDEVALLAMGLRSDVDTEVLLVSVSGEEGDPVRVLTENDPYSVWVFSLSPDGRSIAYGSERPATATLYRMRLPDLGGG